MASNLNIDPITRWKLQVEHQDALIIYAENSPDESDDEIKACELRDAINGFSFDNGHRGKAVLYGETVRYGGSLITSLDDALEFSTVVFALYSKNLEKDRINSQTTIASLYHAIETDPGSFIPVIWKDGNVSTAYAREKKELDMNDVNWKNRLKRSIKSHLEKRLEREREQEHLRSKYAGMFRQATNSVPPNDFKLLYARTPSQIQDGPGNMDHQELPKIIDVNGGDLHPHDADENSQGAPQFPWNYLRYLVSEKGLICFGVLGFVVVSLTLRKLKAR